MLEDVREVLARLGIDRIGGDHLASELGRGPPRPWMTDGRAVTPTRLGRLLSAVGAAPEQLTINGKNVRGYRLTVIEHVLARLPPDPAPFEDEL